MFSDRTNWKLTPNRLTTALEGARRRGARMLDLTVSNPTRVGLHYDGRAIIEALASRSAMDYDPQPKGLAVARAAVADYYRKSHGIAEFDAGRLILTTSTSEGYSFVLRLLCNPGDEIVVPKPSYPLFEFLADLQDVKLVPYPLIYDHGWQVDFASLEKAVTQRTRGVVVVHPNNPTGSYVRPQERELLNGFCRAHALAIIADEVFLDYRLDGTSRDAPNFDEVVDRDAGRDSRSLHVAMDRHAPINKLGGDDSSRFSFAGNREVLTFSLSGLSKISALPQMKVAWIVVSGAGADEAMGRLEVIADTYLSMNAPVQWATPRLLEQRQSMQRQLMARVHGNLAELDSQLARQEMCERLTVDGGWYAVVRVPVTRSDEELAIQLLQEKSVLTHPGHFYDFPRDGYLVLSLITEEQEFREGIRRLLELLGR